MTPTPSVQDSLETVTLAGGCFWGMEELFRQLPGVVDTEVGYTGGHLAQPGYRDVCTGETGHAEALQVKFDPGVLAFAELLKFFFRIHDPTTPNQQGNDRGSQYRSAIFCHSPEQLKVAQEVKDLVEASGQWPRPLVTEIVMAGPFYPAEPEHQDYLQKYPEGYSCHYVRPFQF